LQSDDLASEITAGQVVTLRQKVYAALGQNEVTLIDKVSSNVLGTYTSAATGAQGAGGIAMLAAFNMKEVAYQNITVKADGGTGATVFEDTFDGAFDVSKWNPPAPNIVAFVSVADGAATLNGDDPANAAGDYAYLPTKAQFADFDLQATFTLTDLNSGDGAREEGDFFGIRFRESNSQNAFYQLVVWPNPGTTPIAGAGTNPAPAIALRRATGQVAGETQWEYLAGPLAIATPDVGDTMVLNLRVDGDSITAFVAPDASTYQGPILQATDSNLTEGVIDFVSNGIVGIDLVGYTVWEAGTGSLPNTPLSAQSWTQYE
jgi:hypothetical protein